MDEDEVERILGPMPEPPPELEGLAVLGWRLAMQQERRLVAVILADPEPQPDHVIGGR